MTEARAVTLIAFGMVLLMTASILGMAALGMRGVVLSLGAILPAALAADGVGRVVMHYGKTRRGESSQPRR